MSESEETTPDKGNGKETTEPPVVETKPAQGPPMIAVSPQLMNMTLELLQTELPMRKCRDVVLALERCQVVNMTLGKSKKE